MNTARTLLAATLVIFFLAACQLVKRTPKTDPHTKGGQSSALGTASSNADAATKKSDEANANVNDKVTERDGKLLANINAAKGANLDNPDGPPKEKVDGELTIAQSRLSGTTEDPEEKAAAAQRAVAFEQGRTAEARKAVDEAAKAAQAKADELAKARADAETAKAERDSALAALKAAQAEFIRQTEENKRKADEILAARDRAHAAELLRVQDEERKALYRKVTWALILAAIAAAGFGTFLAYGKFQAGEPFKAGIAAAFWGGCAAFFVTCAWTINQPWFKWVVIIGLSVGVIASIILIVAELRSSREKRQLAETHALRASEADEAEDTLKRIMQAVDQLGDGATVGEVRAKMGRLMNDNNKALINELRAEGQRASVPSVSTT